MRIHQQTDYPSLRNQLRQQLDLLGHQLAFHECHAREIAARPGETGDQPGHDRIAAGEDDRDRRCRGFRRECRRGGAGGEDHVDVAADEVGG